MSVIEQEHGPAPILPAPVPPQAPLPLRQFLRMLRDSAISIYRADAYTADILERKVLWRRSFIVNEPDAIKHVLLDNAANYHKTEVTRRLLEPGLGRGLLTSEDETWRQHRRIMAPSFDHRSILSYSPIMTAVAEELLADWDGLPGDAEIDVAAAMMRATLQIISRTMFSSDSDGIVEIVERGVSRYQTEIRPKLLDLLSFPAWLARLVSGQRPRAIFSEFDRVIERLLAERQAAPDGQPKDLLARLIAARDEETGARMSHDEVRNQVITIFMAGHETTAVALTWTWYLLSLHPAARAKLEDELARVLAGRSPRHDDLPKLSYTRMVIEEAMRLYPPAHSLSRAAVKDDTVLGRRIPAGTQIMISPWLIHRKPQLWHHPERFEPERFAPEQARLRHRFAYFPFGAGPRICIGAAFAMAEAMLMLATIAQRYRMRLKPGFSVEPQGLITLRPRHGMRMLLERRR